MRTAGALPWGKKIYVAVGPDDRQFGAGSHRRRRRGESAMKTHVMPFFVLLGCIGSVHGAEVTIRPQEYPGAFRNPHKGIFTDLPTDRSVDNLDRLGSMLRFRRSWKEFETHEADGPATIREAVARMLADVEDLNYSLRLRVRLHSKEISTDGFPDDLPLEDYLNQTPYFRNRCKRLIEKFGEAIDGDPRVFCFQLGIMGRWGESHNPAPSAETQKAIGDACLASFKVTPVTKRNLKQYTLAKYEDRFGIFDDAIGQSLGAGYYYMTHIAKAYPDLWKTKPRHGEVVFNLRGALGTNSEEIFESDTATRKLINIVRFSHLCHLDWIRTKWDLTPNGIRNMMEIHKALGHRYVITEFRYPGRLTPGEPFAVSFLVKNVGAAPMYWQFPVELSLLDPVTRGPVWKDTFDNVDIRTWIGGEGFPAPANDGNLGNYAGEIYAYSTPPPVHAVRGTFTLPLDVSAGDYVIAIAILGPKGEPGVRFAVKNYYRGGRHPMGYVGVNREPEQFELDSAGFDDLFEDPFCRFE